MAKKLVKTVSDLTPDPMNANKHSEFGSRLLENSIRENGFARSIVISDDNVIIAGNGATEGAVAVGMEDVIVVETDGRKMVAVKRTDIKSGTPEFYKLALADNIVAKKNIVLDAEVVEAIVTEYPATKAWGSIITDPPGQEKLEDLDKANKVSMSFQLTGDQAAKVKQAVKISKELNKTKFDNTGNDNENANALFFIIGEYLKAHKSETKKATENKTAKKKK